MKPLRVVLHAHSTWSYDGRHALSEISRLYRRLGVDAVMMSEHDTGFAPERFDEFRAECAEASKAGALLIPGIEYSSPDNDIHILTWGLARFLGEHRPVTETLADVRDEGGVAIFAHPIRRAAFRQYDPAWTPFLSGIELWNRKSDGISWGEEALRLIAETGLPATVGHDFHRYRQIYPLDQTVERISENRADWEDLIIEALRAGASTPRAFGRPLLTPDGAPVSGAHPRLERLRRGLRDLIKGKPRR